MPSKIDPKNIIWDEESIEWDKEEIEQTQSQKGFLRTTISNIPGSGVNFIKNLITPVIHPIETAKGLGSTGLGFIEQLIPGEQEHEKYADAIIDFMKQRYGGLEEIQNTIQNDPVGFVADISTILTGIGGIGRLGFQAGSTASKVAQIFSKTGKMMEPTSVAMKTLSVVGKPIGSKVIAPTLGLTTGVGTEAIKRSWRGGKEFVRGMRGKVNPEDIINVEKSALGKMKDLRREAYVDELNRISQLQQTIDITPVKNELNMMMSKNHFNIKRTQGGLDFTRSTIDKSGIKDAQEIIEKIDNWGSQVGDLSPSGLDILKRQLDDFYTQNKNTRAMVSGLRNKTKELIVSNVPEYYDMTKGYEKATKLITEIERDLSLGTKKSTETAIRRLIASLRDDNDFRRDMVKTLEQAGGQDLLNQISGYQMRSAIPSVGAHAGLAGRIAAGGMFTAIFGITPQTLTMIASTSPRLVGELSNVLSWSVKQERKIPIWMRQSAYQAGRIEQPQAMVE